MLSLQMYKAFSDELEKIASRLRKDSLKKHAGLTGAVLKTLGTAAYKHPVMTGLAGLSAVTGTMSASGKYKQYKAGFDPTVQQAMLGEPQATPGA